MFTQIISAVRTFFFFGIACLIIPLLIFSATFVFLANELKLLILSALYPNHEFSTTKKLRTLIDTKRNAAIFHFLLEIKGTYNFQMIKEAYLTNLIEKRNKTGELKFPKLRKCLTQRWWHYAWDNDCSKFDIDKHIIHNPRTFRGRAITESNIQEFLSDLVTKYIPSDISPWQVNVIQPYTIASSSSGSNDQQTFYILVKVHHLLIAEEKDLHVSDLLMLSGLRKPKIFESNLTDSKLNSLLEKPKHIPNLWNQIYMTAVNRWNEFIYHYDPLESPDVDKKQQIKCLSQLISVMFITIVTVATDFTRGFSKTNNQIKYKFRYLLHLFERETLKRNLTIESIVDSLTTSLNPINIFKNTIRYTWYIITVIILLTPYYCIKEIFALKDLIVLGHTEYTDTLTGIGSIYVPLIYCAFKEFIRLFFFLLNAPKNFYDELIRHRTNEKNFLHSKTFSGRKVIAFSKSINLDEFRNQNSILNEKGDVEFVLTCLCGALRNYLENFKKDYGMPPKYFNATCRSIKKEFFFEKVDKKKNVGGVLFMKFPLVELKNKNEFEIIRQIIEEVRKKQDAIYLLSVSQWKYDILTQILPGVLMRIFINYFSYNYPITITELYGNSEIVETVWGQEVKDLLFFRPPQSKTCLSLNIHRFGSNVRLAVMADTHLSPDHAKIAKYFESIIENINI